MYLERLRILNFRSFAGEHVVEFPAGAVFILGQLDEPGFDSNGSGKSSLLFAYCWLLMGTLPTGAEKDEIRTWDTSETVVEGWFSNGLYVRRSKKNRESERLSFELDGLEVKGEDLAPAQRKLSDLLNYGSDLFFNSAWIDPESKSVQFVFARPAQRQKILEEIIGESIWPGVRTLVYNRRQALEAEIARRRSVLVQIDKSIKDNQHTLHQAQVAYDAQAEAVQNATALRAAERVSLEKMLEARKLDHAKANNDRHAANKRYREINTDDVNVAIGRLGAELGPLAARIKKMEANVSITDDVCPACLRPLEKSDRATVVETLAKDIARLKEVNGTLQEMYRRRDEAVSLLCTVEKFSDEMTLCQRDVNRLEAKIHEIQLSQVSTVDMRKSEELIETLRVRIGALEKEQKEHHEWVVKADRAVPWHRFWEAGAGSKGIPNLLFDDVRALLEHHVVARAAALAQGQWTIEFPQTANGLEIVTMRKGRKVPIHVTSRGEAWRSNLAVLLGLRGVLQSMSHSPLGTLVLDDPFTALDDAGMAAVIELAIEASRNEAEQVLVTVPHDHADIPPDRVIVVRKRGEHSEVVSL